MPLAVCTALCKGDYHCLHVCVHVVGLLVACRGVFGRRCILSLFHLLGDECECFHPFSVMSACVVCVMVLAVLYGSMWQELSWGLPLAEILQCTHSVDVGSLFK